MSNWPWGSHWVTSCRSKTTCDRPCDCDFLAGQVEFDFVEIDADNSAVRADGTGQVEGDIAAAAADIEARCTAGICTSTRRARVDGPITSESSRNRSRPSTPPRIAYRRRPREPNIGWPLSVGKSKGGRIGPNSRAQGPRSKVEDNRNERHGAPRGAA